MNLWPLWVRKPIRDNWDKEDLKDYTDQELDNILDNCSSVDYRKLPYFCAEILRRQKKRERIEHE